MKNLSLALNIILVLAVGYLYYYDFSGKKTEAVVAKLNSGSIALDSNGHQAAIGLCGAGFVK